MHKLAKGLGKKKKKQKKGKKGEDDEEFDPEELERYRRERAEAQQKLAENSEASGEQTATATAAPNDEWQKFKALTSGVDSIIKETQDSLSRIKETSFFQRKAPEPEPDPEEHPEVIAKKQELAKRYLGFDKDGNPIELKDEEEEGKVKGLTVNEDGLVEIPDDDDENEDFADDDIFDTTYIDALQNVEVQLAYIPDSPTEEELGDDPFDTSNADKVLKTVDKTGKKLVSLGNAVEVLSGRIDYKSKCKISRTRPRVQTDLLLADFEAEDPTAVPDNPEEKTDEPILAPKTLLDDDSDLPDIPVDLTQLPPILVRALTPAIDQENNPETTDENKPLDISEFELKDFTFKDKTLLDDVPVLDDDDFDLDAPVEPIIVEEPEDPFAEKEPEVELDIEEQIIQASFVAASFVNEEDPFDTSIADNLVPGKTELKVIEKELEEVPISEVSISLTDAAGLKRDYETGRLTAQGGSTLKVAKRDLLGGSATDLSQLADKPIKPIEEISYVDPFDTSGIRELPPGKTELKVLEKELLGEKKQVILDDLEDDDFDPRKEEVSKPDQPKKKPPPPRPPPPPGIKAKVPEVKFEVKEEDFNKPVVDNKPKRPPRPPPPPGSKAKAQPVQEVKEVEFNVDFNAAFANKQRKPSRPEALDISKAVAFALPTPVTKPDLLATGEDDKSLPSKPLTPYYPQKSLDEVLPPEEPEDEFVDDGDDPFDTSFVANAAPGKTELKIIESELLKEEPNELSHSLSDHDFDPRSDQPRRQSEVVKSSEVIEELIKKRKALDRRQESILDTEVDVSEEPLAPNVKPSTIEEEIELSYKDPFDTSHATNILPGKAELKLLENELSQVPDPEPIRIHPVIEQVRKQSIIEDDPDFDPRAEDEKEKDILCLDTQEAPSDKILTPIQDIDVPEEDIDPFDTSFASVDPTKTELKLLESELINE